MSLPSQATFSLNPRQWALLLSVFLVFLIVLTGKVRYTQGDTRYSLLVSQSILENGSIALDQYNKELDLNRLNDNHGWMIHHWEETGHDYYFYPIGNSLLSLPAVWIARRFGMDMLYYDQESQLQIMIAGVVLALMFIQLYRLSRLMVSGWSALSFAWTMVLGTSLISTGGVALWSHNFETLAILSVLLELWGTRMGKWPVLRSYRVGALLFVAYLCRPTSMVLIASVVAYVFWQHRSALPKVLIGLFAPFVVFVAWSFWVFSRPVPVYYDPSTWPSNDDFWGNFVAILLSPGRGLWVYMPFTLLVWIGWLQKPLRRDPLWLMSWIWWGLHTVMMARSAMPWGGWCYGSRFYMEMVPGFALMLLLMLENWQSLHARLQKGLPVVYACFACFGIYVHTYQGLYEPATYGWNDNPNIDARWAEEKMDWRYPQFLASEAANFRRRKEAELLLPVGRMASRTPVGSAVLFGQPDLDMRNSFKHWNETDKLKGWRAYNSIPGLEAAKEKSFWFTKDRLPEMAKLQGWRIDSSNIQPTLGAFLEAEKENTVVIALRDEGSYKLDGYTRKVLRSMGSNIDSLKFRASYAAVIEKGKLIWEDLGAKVAEYVWQGETPVKVVSKGMDAGNHSSIKVGEQEVGMNGRGMNVVVLGNTRTVVWSTNFDTHKEDAEMRLLYKAVRLADY